jgi:hypothetical protein
VEALQLLETEISTSSRQTISDPADKSWIEIEKQKEKDSAMYCVILWSGNQKKVAPPWHQYSGLAGA